jgi:hypothetical protein
MPGSALSKHRGNVAAVSGSRFIRVTCSGVATPRVA